MPAKTAPLEKIYQKINKLEQEIAELKFAVLPVEKVSLKELAEYKKTSKEMRKGEFLTAKQALAALDK